MQPSEPFDSPGWVVDAATVKSRRLPLAVSIFLCGASVGIVGCDKSKAEGDGAKKADSDKAKADKSDKDEAKAGEEAKAADEAKAGDAAQAGDGAKAGDDAENGADRGGAPDPNAPTGPVFDEEEGGEDGYVLHLEHEKVGALQIGMKPDEAVEVLGEPKEKGEIWEEEATGDFVSDWTFPDKGVVLHMASADKKGTDMRINAISADKSCTLSFPWGLKVGSTRADVEKIYGDKFHDVVTDDKQFVAGSIYGGTFYNFEDGKVVGIFIGAGAE